MIQIPIGLFAAFSLLMVTCGVGIGFTLDLLVKLSLKAASVDTRPQGGDAPEIAAPFTSGAVPKADAQQEPS